MLLFGFTGLIGLSAEIDGRKKRWMERSGRHAEQSRARHQDLDVNLVCLGTWSELHSTQRV